MDKDVSRSASLQAIHDTIDSNSAIGNPRLHLLPSGYILYYHESNDFFTLNIYFRRFLLTEHNRLLHAVVNISPDFLKDVKGRSTSTFGLGQSKAHHRTGGFCPESYILTYPVA